MFWLIKKILIGLLTGLVYGSNHTKCVSFNNQKCMKFCKTLNDLSNKVWVPNKAEYLDMCVFNLITGINESKEHKREKAYIKAHIYANVNVSLMEENVIQINSEIMINVDVGVNVMYV